MVMLAGEIPEESEPGLLLAKGQIQMQTTEVGSPGIEELHVLVQRRLCSL